MKIFRDYLLVCAEQPTFPTASNSTRSTNQSLFQGRIGLYLLVIEQKIAYFCNRLISQTLQRCQLEF